MLYLLVELSKYLMILLFLIYTFEAVWVLRYSNDSKQPFYIYKSQNRLMFYIHADAFLVLFLTTKKIEMLGFYLMQVILFAAILLMYRVFYKQASRLLINNMCMLMCIGMIILTRLSYEKAFRQYLFMVAGLVFVMLFPLILSSTSSFFRRLSGLYAVVGILSLALVTVVGRTEYGAKLSIGIGSFSIQPSEFVKIIFVFFVASMLYERLSNRRLLVTCGVSGLFVLVLVASKDLGSSLLYFVAFLAMVYVATKKAAYLGIGLGFVSVGSVAAYFLFSHVRTRVAAWQDPLAVYEGAGYQVSRSLFGIGTGGWFGMGLGQGKPSLIPVVEKDVVFSAISEEMGGIFALCLIAVCISCFLIIFNISMQLKDPFYRLVALGLGSIYAMQVFLTIGGVTKFIPSTGVTLPLVSYGGSSLLSTVILFGIIQALYLMQARSREAELQEKEEREEKTDREEKAKREERTDREERAKREERIETPPSDEELSEDVLGSSVSRIMAEERSDSLAEEVTKILAENRRTNRQG